MSNIATVKLLEGTQAINDACDNIKTQGKALDDYIQFTALSVLMHVDNHGDVTVVNRLYASMPKGSRRSALTEFLVAFGKVVANTDPAKKKETPFLYARDKVTLLAEAQDKPWFDFKPDREPDECFDLQKALKAMLAKASKSKQVTDPVLLGELQVMANRAPHVIGLESALPASPVTH